MDPLRRSRWHQVPTRQGLSQPRKACGRFDWTLGQEESGPGVWEGSPAALLEGVASSEGGRVLPQQSDTTHIRFRCSLFHHYAKCFCVRVSSQCIIIIINFYNTSYSSSSRFIERLFTGYLSCTDLYYFGSHVSQFAAHSHAMCHVSYVVRGGERPAVTPQSLKQTEMRRLWWCWTTSPRHVTPQLCTQMKASSSSWRKAQSCWLWKWRGWEIITWRTLAAMF